jgi:hypothetical protein
MFNFELPGLIATGASHAYSGSHGKGVIVPERECGGWLNAAQLAFENLLWARCSTKLLERMVSDWDTSIILSYLSQ